MAYVVARRNGRFELRESLHTPQGPRARTLAGFAVLSDDVLARAAARAQRPFNAAAAIDSGRRAGAQIVAGSQWRASSEQALPDRGKPVSEGPAPRSKKSTQPRRAGSGSFLAATARMARSVRRDPAAERVSPGDALIDLLGFADAVRASQPPRPAKPLAFPAIARLSEHVGPRRRPVGLAHR